MSKSAHPKFIGLTLTPSGGMLGAWEDGSVARWVPSEPVIDDAGIVTAFTDSHWVAITSPDYETLFCTTTKTSEALDADALRREGAREALERVKGRVNERSVAWWAAHDVLREYPATPHTRATDELNLELAPDVAVEN